jgi:chemotaxis protein CheD
MSSIAELLAASGVAVRRDPEVQRASDGTRLFFLHAGHLHVSAEPTQITTILGSCVSIGLWDPVAGVGGMNHYMLPEDISATSGTPRYANFAIRHLIGQLELLGAHRARLLAGLYGGASIISSIHAAGGLGARNVEVGRTRLRQANIPIVAEDTGHTHGRKITFFTSNGSTTVKRI